MAAKGFLTQWYLRHLANTEAFVFILFILAISIIIFTFGHILLPLLMALVLAYLLEWPIARLEKLKIPRLFSVVTVFILFVSLLILTILGIVPVLKQQLGSLLDAMPDMLIEGKKLLITIQAKYPQYITDNQLVEIVDTVKTSGTTVGKYFLTLSLASIHNILTTIFYLVLVPILVFLLLKDKTELAKQAKFFMPEESSLTYKILEEVHVGLGNYIRGKFLEALIIGVLVYIMLRYFNMQYNVLLSVLVAISVFFPFVGAIVATIPLAAIGLFQMGLGHEFAQLMLVYVIIHLIDGHIVVPIVLAEALNMRIIFIITAIIFFGGLFGFWGVVFAIPLAILIRAVINLWPGLK